MVIEFCKHRITMVGPVSKIEKSQFEGFEYGCGQVDKKCLS